MRLKKEPCRLSRFTTSSYSWIRYDLSNPNYRILNEQSEGRKGLHGLYAQRLELPGVESEFQTLPAFFPFLLALVRLSRRVIMRPEPGNRAAHSARALLPLPGAGRRALSGQAAQGVALAVPAWRGPGHHRALGLRGLRFGTIRAQFSCRQDGC